ncbi:nucleotidyltransferase domain-containing protein [Streptomyces sp. NPDC057654]|uniref:nucleotidyltransferase domain-containing protein n=1 Tax=Streptomyces sp. NPDC057654 TaxID=3346196 RepID=UPI0036BB59F4
MLGRLEGGGWPLDLVDEILVFGSYARGALNPSDVDMVVEHRRDDRLTSEFLHSLSYGGDPSASMKRALKGRSRGLQIHFGERESLEAEGFELTLLWTRGEPVDAARARLAAITPDPEAGRAPRDHMIEAFDGIDRRVPRPVRITHRPGRPQGRHHLPTSAPRRPTRPSRSPHPLERHQPATPRRSSRPRSSRSRLPPPRLRLPARGTGHRQPLQRHHMADWRRIRLEPLPRHLPPPAGGHRLVRGRPPHTNPAPAHPPHHRPGPLRPASPVTQHPCRGSFRAARRTWTGVCQGDGGGGGAR